MDREQESPHNDANESMTELVRGIVQDARTLSAKELAAAKLEIGEEIKKVIRSSVSLGVGIFLAATGFLLLSIMFAFIITWGTQLPVWAGFAIVGTTYLLVGAVVVITGQRKLKSTKPIPRDTLRSAKQDAQVIRDKATGH